MKVIDGAIKSASVCRDKNANSACDQVEFRQADATGQHHLQGRGINHVQYSIPNPKELGLVSRTFGQLRPPIAACDSSVGTQADLMRCQQPSDKRMA